MSPENAEHRIPIRRALVSVYDKAGLDDLVRGLHDAGVELVSTGGSAALIEGLARAERAGIPTFVRQVSDFETREGLTVEGRRVRIGAAGQ